uniref:Uncharacterized protein n=1 Tax=Romanomermis culicivorax TaxID=13658 RepID=A0A915HTZ4_ROMCU
MAVPLFASNRLQKQLNRIVYFICKQPRRPVLYSTFKRPSIIGILSPRIVPSLPLLSPPYRPIG